jgi:hypothetical protein
MTFFIVCFGYFGRTQIVHVWPQAAAAYKMVGIPMQALGEGLEFKNITSRRERLDIGSILIVQGQVVNSSRRVQQIPPLRARLNDAQRRILHEWIFTATPGRLLPGESAAFTTQLRNPASGAVGLTITFVAEE